MYSYIVNFFSSTKNILMAIGSALVVGYVGLMKFRAYQAESKLKDIENKIAKTNVVIAKTKAKAKAQAVKAETTAEVKVLRDLKKQSTIVKKEMENHEKEIQKKLKEKLKKVSNSRRRRGKNINEMV